jgi:hypothetical protein
MNRLTFIIGIALLTTYGKAETIANMSNIRIVASVNIDTTYKKITFYKVNGEAILLGDSISLLDQNFNVIKDISYLNEQFVNVVEVSDNYHKARPTDDYCQEFKYVKIKIADIEGYVDGRKLYEPIETTQNKKITFDDNEVWFIASSYFGIGVSDNDGLTGCSINTPVVFSDQKSKYEGLVKMVKNKNYEADYPYFELKDDDGANDEILSVVKQNDKYLLKIKRSYQEGGANLLVLIYKDKTGTFVAEIVENEHTEE